VKRFIIVSAGWFGAGFSPIASGTVGTAAAIPLYLLIRNVPLPFYIAFTLLFTVFSCWAADRAEEVFGEKDSGKIVIDEVAGFVVTMTAVPFSWKTVALGFLLFRFFDVTKIPPARYFDRKVKNGIGVVFDDIVAGIYSCISLHLLTGFL
jgi:phosphatidylglycerophosphatase A